MVIHQLSFLLITSSKSGKVSQIVCQMRVVQYNANIWSLFPITSTTNLRRSTRFTIDSLNNINREIDR